MNGLFDKIKALMDKYGFEGSDSLVWKAKSILEQKRIKPQYESTYATKFHVCPSLTEKETEGYSVIYYSNKDIWLCTCRAESYRGGKWEKICSHILASVYVLEEMKK